MADEQQHYHAEHCGLYVGITLSQSEGSTATPGYPETVPTKCLSCGSAITARKVTAWEHARYNALDDDCKNCGEGIIFLADQLRWVHIEDDSVSVLEPTYGIQFCESVMGALMGLPVGTSLPEYANFQAEPVNTHVTLDLKTGEQQTSSEKANQITDKALEEALGSAALTSLLRSVSKGKP